MLCQVQEFVRTEELNSRVIQVLWEKFALKIPQTSAAESRGALMLLGMAAGSVPEMSCTVFLFLSF